MWRLFFTLSIFGLSHAEIPWDELQTKLKDHRIISIAQTPHGLWLGTHRGIVSVDASGRISARSSLADGRAIERPTAFAALGQAVFVATEHGLLRFQAPDSWEVRSTPAPPVSLAVDDGHLLVGTENGFYALDDWASGKFSSPGQIDPDLSLEPRYFILSILPQPDGWLVGTNHGLGRIDRKTGKGQFLFRKLGPGLQTASVNQIFRPEIGNPAPPRRIGAGGQALKSEIGNRKSEIQRPLLCTSMGLAFQTESGSAWRILTFDQLPTEQKPAEESALEMDLASGDEEKDDDAGSLSAPGSKAVSPKMSEKPKKALPPSSNWLWCAAEFQGYLVFGTRSGLWVKSLKGNVWRLVTPADKKLPGQWVTALLPLGEHLLLGTDQGLELWSRRDWETLFGP